MDFLNSPNLLLLGTLFKMETINHNYMILLIFCYTFISFIINSIDIRSIKGYIENHTKKIINDIFNNKIVSIVLTTHTVVNQIGYSNKTQKKNIYSTKFIGLLDYLKSINIQKKKEILTTQLKDTSYRSFDDIDDTNRYQFIPAYFEDILISEKEGIYLRMTCFRKNCDDDDDKNNNLNKLEATLYCYYQTQNDINNKIKILNDFINKIEQNYIDKISKKDDKQYIYVYQKTENIDEETRLIYSEFVNIHNKNFSNVFIQNKKKLMNYINKFKQNPDEKIIQQYEKMGIPYKAGILFYGSPGTGKTSTIKAILKETNRHGIIINLSNIRSNNELENVFRNRKINNKNYDGKQLCFILEDCDATKLSSIKERKKSNDSSFILTDKPENHKNSNDRNLSDELKTIIASQKCFDLSCFLNILDGIVELHGVMIILSTNHPDKIDEALIRPGRIDFKYEFKKSSKQIICEMIQVKYDITEEKLKEIITPDGKSIENIKDYILSPAEIQCILSQNETIEDCLIEIFSKQK
jgi:AAA+ superfamily predicted ATPase